MYSCDLILEHVEACPDRVGDNQAVSQLTWAECATHEAQRKRRMDSQAALN